MTTYTLPLAAAAESSSLWSVSFNGTVGILIALSALAGIWIAVAMLARLLKRIETLEARLREGSHAGSPSASTPSADQRVSASATVAPASQRVSPAAITGSDEDDPSVIAAITAAVAAVLGGQSYRIVSITPDVERVRAWSSEGRREIYQSHRVR